MLVLGHGFGNGAGDVHLGGLNPALLAAPAQHDHAAFGHALVRNAARYCCVHNGPGAGSEAHVFVKFPDLFQCMLDIEWGVVLRGDAQGVGEFKRQATHHLFRVFNNHLKDTRVNGWRRASKGHGTTRLCLQVDSSQAQHMGQRHAVVLADGLQAADPRKARAKPSLEPWLVGDGTFLRSASHHDLNGGVLGPQVRAAKRADT